MDSNSKEKEVTKKLIPEKQEEGNDINEDDSTDQSDKKSISSTKSRASKNTSLISEDDSITEMPKSPIHDLPQSFSEDNLQIFRDKSNKINLENINKYQREYVREAWHLVKVFFDTDLPDTSEGFLNKYNRTCKKYFGKKGAEAFSVFDKIREAINKSEIIFYPLSDEDSEGEALAMSEKDIPIIRLGKHFYQLPKLDQYAVLIHELSHIFAGTLDLDHFYGDAIPEESKPHLTHETLMESVVHSRRKNFKEMCKELAKENDTDATLSAYNYEFSLHSMYARQKKNDEKGDKTSESSDEEKGLSSDDLKGLGTDFSWWKGKATDFIKNPTAPILSAISKIFGSSSNSQKVISHLEDYAGSSFTIGEDEANNLNSGKGEEAMNSPNLTNALEESKQTGVSSAGILTLLTSPPCPDNTQKPSSPTSSDQSTPSTHIGNSNSFISNNTVSKKPKNPKKKKRKNKIYKWLKR